MSIRDDISAVRAVYDAFDRKALEELKVLMAPDASATLIASGSTVGLLEYWQNWATGFPNGRCDITRVVAQEDCVVVEFTGRGSHEGPLSGPSGVIPPTHRWVELQLCDVWELNRGKLASLRSYFDAASLMAQLGVAMPTAVRAPQPSAHGEELRH